MMMQFVSCFKIHGAVFFPVFKTGASFCLFPSGKSFFLPQSAPAKGGLKIW